MREERKRRWFYLWGFVDKIRYETSIHYFSPVILGFLLVGDVLGLVSIYLKGKNRAIMLTLGLALVLGSFLLYGTAKTNFTYGGESAVEADWEPIWALALPASSMFLYGTALIVGSNILKALGIDISARQLFRGF